MVTFIPPFMGEEVKSNAERKMFDVLQELELKNAYVLHSLGLPKHNNKIYGEIDFVVICDRGVLCLEIKGGRVECREGRWIFTDRYGVEREKTEGPFAQVTGNMFSLLNVLKERFASDPHLKNVLVGCGVVFPDIVFKSTGQEIIPEIIYDRTTDDITDYINTVYDYWEGRQHRQPFKLPPNTIKEIVDYLRGEFTFVQTLDDRLEDVEKRLIRLTSEQSKIMEALSANTHLMIEGSAGTGKTVLAMDFACKNADAGKKVLYVTFNKNLANNLIRNVEGKDTLKIINIHALFGEYIQVDVEDMKGNPQKYFGEILPEAFCQYIGGLSAQEAEQIQYDLIVMDEGQDILRPHLLYALDMIVKGGLERGAWALFYDERQNIYNPEYEEGMELLEMYDSTKFKLFTNCRNTVQIGNFGEKISGWVLGDFIRENGEDVKQISYDDNADYKLKVESLLKELRNANVDMRNVTFISPKRYIHSKLNGLGVMVNELGDEFDPQMNKPRFSTIPGFKGLDSKIVILCDVEDIKEKIFSQMMYIAVTRARTLLYVVGSREFWQNHKLD